MRFELQAIHFNYFFRFVRYVRFVHTGGMAFLKAQCRAKMRRSLVYNIDMKVDQHGIFQECQCDCAAGMGPSAHCKHVRAVFRVMMDHGLGKTMQLELTCTEQIQTFHKPKRLHQGSPVKAANLKLGKHADDSDLIFNPVPPMFRESREQATARLNNLTISYAARTSLQPAALLSIPPANIYAVCHDHDHMELTPEMMFLKREGLVDITRDTCADIAQRTMNQAGSKEWFNERKKRLTASHFGRICKATTRTDMKKLARSLMTSKTIRAKSLLHGKEYEAIAIQAYCEVAGAQVAKSGLVIDPGNPYLAGSPDGIVNDIKIIEVKCPFASREHAITPVTVPYLQLDGKGSLMLKPNHDYMYQIQGNMYLTGATECDLVVYTFKDLKIVNIVRDNIFISAMLSNLHRFYETHFLPEYLGKNVYRNTHLYVWD